MRSSREAAPRLPARLLTSLDTERDCETRKALLAGIAFHLVS
jgi:hypothetical protein